MNKVAIITHTDMDGVGSAGLYLYMRPSSRYRVLFAEPYSLNRPLRKLLSAEFDKIVIADMGINPSIYEEVRGLLDEIARKGVEIEWYDHHVWDEPWVKEMKAIGVKLYLDVSTCSTGVVYKALSGRRGEEGSQPISDFWRGVCAGDMWTFDHWLGGYYMRLVRRRDSNEWRMKIIQKISEGVFFDEEMSNKVVEEIEAELAYLRDEVDVVLRELGNGVRVAIALQSELVENSVLASYIMARHNADIAVIASKDGKLSFRSSKYNVRDLALALGGGGHLKASGAKVSVPLHISVLSRLTKKPLLEYVADIVEEHKGLIKEVSGSA